LELDKTIVLADTLRESDLYTIDDSMNENRKILIVDDDIFNIEAIKVILEHRFAIFNPDTICEIAMNGKEAV
jgi:PleD family two-component response regulator